MKKMAIFAEGFTEQPFAEKLLLTIAGEKNIKIEKDQIRLGGKRGPRQASGSTYSGAKGKHKYYALIRDCGTDNRVTSDLISNYKSLCAEGYSFIVGMRDARGQDDHGKTVTLADIRRIRPLMKYGMSRKPIDPVMVLAIMETEAWFLAEYDHFAKIHASLTLERIIQTINFDPSVGNVEHRETPAEDIDMIYRTARERYLPKKIALIQRTIDALDFAKIYCELPDRVSEIKPLVDVVEAFLS